MGLLSEGTPLDWPEVKKVADHVREHGITQLINIFERLQGRTNDALKWGDEVCLCLCTFVCVCCAAFELDV